MGSKRIEDSPYHNNRTSKNIAEIKANEMFDEDQGLN